MTKQKTKRVWIITDWGGGIKHPSVSIFDTKKDALKELAYLEEMPDPSIKGKRNKITKAKLYWEE